MERVFEPKSIIIFFVLLILTVTFGIVGAKYSRENHALQKEGVEVQGKVLSMSVPNIRNGSYRLTYSFLANYTPKRGTDSVTKACYEGLTVGSSIPITYVKSNPRINKTRFSIRRDAGRFFLIVGLNLAIMAFIVIFMLFKRFFLRID